MDYLRIGLIVRPVGIRGEIKVRPLTDDVRRFLGLKRAFVELGVHAPFAVESAALRGGDAVLKLAGVDGRSEAEKLRGRYICVAREDAAPLPEGRYFICDLEGCDVFCSDGKPLGKLAEVLQYPANDVYVIRGEREFMVPALRRLLKSVDTGARRIVLDAAVLREVAVYDED